MDNEAPSKAYFERKCAELATTLSAESLTSVTTVEHEDSNLLIRVAADPQTGICRLSTKSFAVAMPTRSEELRKLFRTMAACWNYLKLKCPHRRCL